MSVWAVVGVSVQGNEVVVSPDVLESGKRDSGALRSVGPGEDMVEALQVHGYTSARWLNKDFPSPRAFFIEVQSVDSRSKTSIPIDTVRPMSV
jgi:hypothetical protein